jgi:hypothetical protein
MMHAPETEELVTYLGRAVPKRGFRAFIYNVDGRRKLTESWDEFDLFIHSDGWFATEEEVQGHLEVPKKAPKKKVAKPEQEKPVVVDGLIEEDFLPNETGE